jgi:hypothetical protein
LRREGGAKLVLAKFPELVEGCGSSDPPLSDLAWRPCCTPWSAPSCSASSSSSLKAKRDLLQKFPEKKNIIRNVYRFLKFKLHMKKGKFLRIKKL